MSVAGGECEVGSIFLRIHRSLFDKIVIRKKRNDPIGMSTYDFVDVKILREDGTYADPYEIGSSAIFVRRYMNSDYAARMDRIGFIDRPTDEQEAFASLDAQYGSSRYGSELYSPEELFWIGYIQILGLCFWCFQQGSVQDEQCPGDAFGLLCVSHTGSPAGYTEIAGSKRDFIPGRRADCSRR